MNSDRELKARADSEKITLNLGFVDLGHVDLLVRDGFYSNRSDFIRTAIRNQLERHGDVARAAVARVNTEAAIITQNQPAVESWARRKPSCTPVSRLLISSFS